MDEENGEKGYSYCPLGRFFLDMEDFFGKKSDFFLHMNKSKIEFFKGIRSLLDEKIKTLEQTGTQGKERKADRINVD
ncbi:hypothetical protein JXL19_10630 [bacterium]|nr:hypothetical protein [bacterium]